jgi:hypothetical protein
MNPVEDTLRLADAALLADAAQLPGLSVVDPARRA